MRAAYFDVDGTLTTGTTLFGFLEFLFDAQGRPPAAYRAERARLAALTVAGVDRATTNREYYRNLTGLDADHVADLGRAWVDAATAGGEFFHAATVAALHQHRARGDRTVLVSGSFPALLNPLLVTLGADEAFCSAPEIVDGRYTGHIGEPMIGPAKARAVCAHMTDNGIDPRGTWGYGDHISDLAVLELVGCPVVVADADPALSTLARQRNWARLR